MFLRNGLEPWHLIVVALVVILLFGSKKLPDSARSLGKSLRILKSETRALREQRDDATPPGQQREPDTAAAQAPPAPSPAPPGTDGTPASPAPPPTV